MSQKQFNTIGNNKLSAIDLFCGCGGLSAGLKMAGFRVLGAVEVDLLAVENYKANHRRVNVWRKDISAIDVPEFAASLGLLPGQLDLLAGCPPCQGFSTMRTLNGSIRVDDPRNNLLLDFQRFVDVLRPRAVMLENVPGLADDERFVKFCADMRRLGYVGECRILNVEDYGVPQRRNRLIYLAGLGFQVPFAGVAARRNTVRKAIALLPKAGESGDPLHDIKERRSSIVMERIRRISKNGGSRSGLPTELQLDCHKRCNGFKDVYGRMSWDNVAPTITSGCFNPSKGRFLHPEEDRAITLREAALLQGFPRKYKFTTVKNKSAVALMIGNALPPPFIKAHAIAIRLALQNRLITETSNLNADQELNNGLLYKEGMGQSDQ